VTCDTLDARKARHTQPMNTFRKILGFSLMIMLGWVAMYAIVIGAGIWAAS
jgi:hypothetical protein